MPKKPINRVPAKPIRQQVMENAISHTCGDRNKIYGDPVVNYTHTAGMLTAYFADKIGYQFTAEDAAMIQVLVKQSRIAGGKFKLDNYEDAAAYIGIAAECAI